MLDPTDLRECIIDPTLKAMDMYSPEASDLVLGTGLAESGLRKLRQVGGPARGLFQMEPATEADILKWLTAKCPLVRVGSEVQWRDIRDWIGRLYGACSTREALTESPTYSVILCRLHYWRRPEILPKTAEEMAAYHKKWYNTVFGKADERKTVEWFRKARKAV